jgi:tetratricopeptide (TPR) repeat protein
MDYFIAILIRELTREKFCNLIRQLEGFGTFIDQTEKDIIIGRHRDINIITCLLKLRDIFPEIRFGFSQYVGLSKGLARIAKFGEILISEEVEPKAIEEYQITSLGMLSIEGMKSQILVCRVDAPLRDPKFPVRPGAEQAITRSAEIEALKGLLTVTKGVIVIGATGAGKTSFLDQLIEANSDRLIIRTACPDYMASRTLKPVMDIVQQMLGLAEFKGIEEKQKAIEKKLRDLEIRDLGTAYLAMLDFLTLSEEESILEKLAPKTRFEIITNSISETLLKITWKTPVMIFIEDADNMDAASREFIQVIMQNLSYENVFFIFTSTRSQIGINGLKDFELRDIDKRQLEDFIEIRIGERIDIGAATPFQVSQYLLLYDEEKAAYNFNQYAGETTMVSFNLPFHDLRTIIKRRLDLLEERREMLYALAVCGTEIDPQDFPIDQKDFSQFDYFVDSDYLRKVYHRYAFTSPQLHDEIYNLISDKEERHLRFADYYRRMHGYEEFAAFHYLSGGNHKKAIEFLMKSATLALKKGGYQSSIIYYQQALELCRHQKDSVSMETLLALNEGLADIYRALGDEDKALKYYKVVLDSYKEILKE